MSKPGNPIEEHWAVRALDQSLIERARRCAQSAMEPAAMEEEDVRALMMTGFAYEMAGMDALDSFLSVTPAGASRTGQTEVEIAASRAFEFLRPLPLPEEDVDRMYHVLRLGSLGTIAHRAPDVQRWIAAQESALRMPLFDATAWDMRILVRVFNCWLDLFRAREAAEADAIPGAIALLRAEQPEHEAAYIDTLSHAEMRAAAFRLLALQHWAKATEELALFWVLGKPSEIESHLQAHLSSARTTAARSGDAYLEVVLPWIHAAALVLLQQMRTPV